MDDVDWRGNIFRSVHGLITSQTAATMAERCSNAVLFENAQDSVDLLEKSISEQVIIIIFYFENVAFFHAKLGSDVCPRVDNQTYGDTFFVNNFCVKPYVVRKPGSDPSNRRLNEHGIYIRLCH